MVLPEWQGGIGTRIVRLSWRILLGVKGRSCW